MQAEKTKLNDSNSRVDKMWLDGPVKKSRIKKGKVTNNWFPARVILPYQTRRQNDRKLCKFIDYFIYSVPTNDHSIFFIL